jgi:hypothetical protein
MDSKGNSPRVVDSQGPSNLVESRRELDINARRAHGGFPGDCERIFERPDNSRVRSLRRINENSARFDRVHAVEDHHESDEHVQHEFVPGGAQALPATEGFNGRQNSIEPGSRARGAKREQEAAGVYRLPVSR